MPRIAIIGTGLIGASIGLRLQADEVIRDLSIVGSDRYHSHAKKAQKLGAIDQVERDPARAVRGASLVILCVPVLALRRVMREIAPALEEGAVVTDTGSTKAEVMRWAEEELPRGVHFIGGHPMAGKTDAGPEAADASLFEGARWVIVVPPSVPPSAINSVSAIVESMGAEPLFMDAAEHDAYVAAVSHLPMVAAISMFTLAFESEAWPELSRLAAAGFRDTVRLAATEPNVAHDIVVTNRHQLVHWIERYREALLDLKERIEDEDAEEDLFQYIAKASLEFTDFMEGAVGRKESDPEGGQPKFGISDLLMGSLLKRKVDEMGQRAEQRLEDQEREQRLRRNE